MQLLKIALGTVSIAAVLCGTTFDAWARGGGGDPGASCVVEKKGKGAVVLKGTVAVDITSGVDSGGIQDIDLTLRLDNNDVPNFFRLHQQLSLNGLFYETVLCSFLDPEATGDPDPAVQSFVDQILDAFGLSHDHRLVIILPKSITDVDAVDNAYFCVDSADPCALHWSNIAEVKIFAIQ